MNDYYGLSGRLVDYRRKFEKTVCRDSEDPSIFATELETLAVKAFGDMGPSERVRMIRDRFVGGSSPISAASSVCRLPLALSLPGSLSAPVVGLPVLPPVAPVRIGPGHVLHPFSLNHFDAGPVRLASIAHAFNYRIAVLQGGSKPATRTVHSRRAERIFLDDVSLPWGQQVVVMFQIMCAFALDVPAAAACVTDFYGVSPDVLLAYEHWGQVEYAGVACGCRTSDRMGAYVHTIASDHHDLLEPAGLLSQPALSDSGDMLLSGTIFNVPDPTSPVEVPLVQPGAVPFVFCRAGAYGRLLLATHERMMTGDLVACDWLRPVTRGGGGGGVWRVAPPISVVAHTDVSLLGCIDCWVCVWIAGSVVVLLLMHILYVFLRVVSVLFYG